ncbi:MAG: hypothetical protein ACOY3P_06100 [Planctomycetota bacterium]
MNTSVEIHFACWPLRSVARFDAPPDASAEEQAIMRRIREAAARHGAHNTYYLYDGQCTFRLTNEDATGLLVFGFEGTVFTDPSDLKTLRTDLIVELESAACDWLTAPVAEWFHDTVREAVRVDFDRFIAAGDLTKTLERLARLEAESAARGGYLGLGI